MESKKSFITQVTTEQLKAFFLTQGFNVSHSFLTMDDCGKHIYVSTEKIRSTWDFTMNVRLYDFGSTAFEREWMTFLSTTFGKEYLVALKEHLTAQNDHFIKSLTPKKIKKTK